ncbi:MAG: hypothetical protein CMH54_07130 [Myxococcales bacterium]|nr:hypothetical protein [Myxococcales bacterium]|tara:strand:- start:522 stop:1208 length:687 start_codon:yes stop_codon:yes gene_type:complete
MNANRSIHQPDRVPLFPLPDHVLLPGVPTPYRIFEPRYRLMIQDLLEKNEEDRLIAIPRMILRTEEDLFGCPPFHHIGVVGRMIACSELPGDEYHVLIEGLDRFLLEEEQSSRPYRVASAAVFEDDHELDDNKKCARKLASLTDALMRLSKGLGADGDALASLAANRSNIKMLTYRVGAIIIQDPGQRQRFLEESRLLSRMDMILEILAGLMALVKMHGAGKSQTLVC